MEPEISRDHPMRQNLHRAIHGALTRQLGMAPAAEVENYLEEMLLRFLRLENLYAIRDADGRRVESVAEMLLHADVRFFADSFDREREVHRHIGDLMLFWSGVFPESLGRRHPKDAAIDPVQQGRMSYYVVSTFDHPPYDEEATVFRKLSRHFEAYQVGLNIARDHLGWA